MRYAFLLCAAVILVATPLSAGEFSPIIISTGKPTPSTVRSGEPFRVTYRTEFFDTVLILEDRMSPENIALENIEVIGLEINKNLLKRPPDDKLGFINVWEFTYTFRIINPEKKVYKVPPFNFLWVLKKAGTTVADAKEKEKIREHPTAEIAVNYVSSIVKPPPLDIRDDATFTNPLWRAGVLRNSAYGIIATGVLFGLILVWNLVSLARKRLKPEEQNIKNDEKETEIAVAEEEPLLPPRQARKRFLRELELVPNDYPYPVLRNIVRTLVLSELNQNRVITASRSDTPSQILEKLHSIPYEQENKFRPSYWIIRTWVERLRVYEQDMDKGMCSIDVLSEKESLSIMVLNLKLHQRIKFFLKRIWLRRR